MQFGFTLKPDHTIERTLALTRQAEAAGFDYGWLFDSHVLWREPYVLLTLMAQATTRLRLGTCVTNPATREPSRDRVGPGRPRRDVAAAGWTSASGAATRPGACSASRRPRWPPSRRRSSSSRPSSRVARSTYEGTELHLPWTGRWTLPVWVAGYGPMALAMTGRVADGIILQLADPDLIRWFVGQVREAAAAAGRDPASITVQAAAAGYVGPREVGRERTRWFPALVSNHVVDLVNKYPREQLPGSPDRLHPRPRGLRLPPPRRGRLVQRRVRRRRGDRPVLRARAGRGARRQAARARRRRRRPVQPLPHERRRGSPARGLRPRRHPRLRAKAAAASRRGRRPAWCDPAPPIVAAAVQACPVGWCGAVPGPYWLLDSGWHVATMLGGRYGGHRVGSVRSPTSAVRPCHRRRRDRRVRRAGPVQPDHRRGAGGRRREPRPVGHPRPRLAERQPQRQQHALSRRRDRAVQAGGRGAQGRRPHDPDPVRLHRRRPQGLRLPRPLQRLGVAADVRRRWRRRVLDVPVVAGVELGGIPVRSVRDRRADRRRRRMVLGRRRVG